MGRIRDHKQDRAKGGGKRTARKAKRAGIGGLGCFGAIWLLFVFAFDGFIGYGLWRTYDASRRYQSTIGVVTESRVESSTDSDGDTSYAPKISYAFELDGVTYTGDRHSFLSFGTSSQEHARKILRRYPQGAKVTVYYDPGNPSQSVLEVDARSFPSIAILFLTPFHCIGFGLIFAALGQWRKRRSSGEDAIVADLRVRGSDQMLVLRDSHWRPWIVFFMTLGVTSFISVFVVAFGLGGGASTQTVLMFWSGCVLAAMTMPTILSMRRRAEGDTLEIDWARATFTRRPGSIDVPIASIRTIRLTTHNTDTKVNGRPWLRHELQGIDASGHAHQLLVVRGFRPRGAEVQGWFAQRFEAAAEESDLPGEESPSMPAVSEVEIHRTKS